MNLFGDTLSDEENALLEDNQQQLNDFEKIKKHLIQTKYKKAENYLRDANSIGEIILIAKAYDLGPEYAEALNDELDFEEQKVALYGFQQGLNVIEQIKGGEDLDNLVLLIKASKKENFNLMDYFDSTGSFINYPKLSNFLHKM